MSKKSNLTSLLPFVASLFIMLAIFGPTRVDAVGQDFDVPSGIPTESSPAPVDLKIPDTTLTVRGCAAPNAFVTLFEDNQPIGTVIAGAFGRYSKTVVGQKYGLHTIKAFYEDANERTSSAVTRNVSLASHANTDLELFLTPTITVSPTSLFVGNHVTFRGTTTPGAIINVSIDNNTTVVAIANNRGNWFVTVDTENYFIGTHVFQAIAAKDGCGATKATEKLSFRVNRPSADDFLDSDAPALLLPPIITEPNSGFLASNPDTLLVGEALPNAQLEIFIDNNLAGSTFANAQGQWTFPFTMTARRHTLKTRMCINGSCSDFSNEVEIIYQGDFDGCKIQFRLANYRFYNLKPGSGIDLELLEITGTGQYQILIDWGDTTIEHTTLYRDNQSRFHHVFNETGQFNGVITIEDANKCIYSQYISINTIEAHDFNWWWLLLIGVPPLTVVTYRATHKLRRIRVRYVN